MAVRDIKLRTRSSKKHILIVVILTWGYPSMESLTFFWAAHISRKCELTYVGHCVSVALSLFEPYLELSFHIYLVIFSHFGSTRKNAYIYLSACFFGTDYQSSR